MQILRYKNNDGKQRQHMFVARLQIR